MYMYYYSKSAAETTKQMDVQTPRPNQRAPGLGQPCVFDVQQRPSSQTGSPRTNLHTVER